MNFRYSVRSSCQSIDRHSGRGVRDANDANDHRRHRKNTPEATAFRLKPAAPLQVGTA
jgi:hypothetical protein